MTRQTGEGRRITCPNCGQKKASVSQFGGIFDLVCHGELQIIDTVDVQQVSEDKFPGWLKTWLNLK